MQRGLFPPWIAGLTVFLVGVTLIGVGIKVGCPAQHTLQASTGPALTGQHYSATWVLHGVVLETRCQQGS